MMGPKKLSTKKQKLKDAAIATSDTPVVWLEKCMARRKRGGERVIRELEALCRALKEEKKTTRRKPRAKTGK